MSFARTGKAKGAMAGELERRKQRSELQQAAQERILTIRRQHVILDSDLAEFYGVETEVLNRARARNPDRFPEDFAFQLTSEEWARLLRQIGGAKSGRGGRRTRPWVFTEQGALQAAGVLRSGKAAEVSLEIVRAFIKMRDRLHQVGDLTAALNHLREELIEHVEERTAELQTGQADLNAQVDTLTELMKVTQQALKALQKSERRLPQLGDGS
jgi:DNA-binding transcriptional MerR regulator